VDDSVANTHPGLSPGHHALLRIRDSGHGMAAEVLERAFEPFFTTKAPGVGTGLGLAAVRSIVTAHGDCAYLVSQVGGGTTVEIYLPAYVGGAEATIQAGGRRILLVEDEAELAAMMQHQIEALGYAVTVRTSSIEALETFSANPRGFDLLITDNTMPKLTGLELARAVTRARPDLPVLLVSGYTEQDQGVTLQTHGVRRFLHKPHTGPQLAREIVLLIGPGRVSADVAE
jgi:CheY-like chemotaxis protein